MAHASYVQASFLGGEISKLAQGRIERPDYRACLNVCLNGHPIEPGGWTRRAGTMFAGTTRGGTVGRVVKFDFQSSSPYTLEFTNGSVRFRVGTRWAVTNDKQAVVAVSAANPAVVQTAAAVTWATGDTAIFLNLATSIPLLQARQFTLTKVDTTHFSLADALTGNSINGGALGSLAIPGGATIARIQEVASPYIKSNWDSIRVVQAETTAIVLDAITPPQAIQVTALPSATANAQFSLAGLTFLDGPYLDPFTNGVQANPSAKSGIVTITLTFPTWLATTAYPAGAFVTLAGVNYVSLQDQNVNNAPAGLAPWWATTSAGAAIGPNGFQGTDIGRLVRLLSEPAAWDATVAYVAGNIVSYNPSGIPGASTYWFVPTAGGSTGVIPGSTLTNWAPSTNAALWSWGKITGLANLISPTLAGSVNIGTLTANGGLAAAFDSVLTQAAAACAAASSAGLTLNGYVGKNYSGAAAQVIQSGTCYPSSNLGFCSVKGVPAGTITINLRAKATPPASSSDGTLLGTTGSFPNGVNPVTIQSNDAVTAWNYVWFEIIATVGIVDASNTIYCGEAQFFKPPGTGSSGISVEILGPPLLYTTPIQTWRLGVYSATTGYPTCGTWHEGRLWLGGSVANRFDISVSNGLVGRAINFAPTDQNGVVSASSAISYVTNSDGVNPIEWMSPDLQGVIMGTLAGEWLTHAPTPGSISPFNIASRRVTRIGAANVEPRRTEHTLAFVQRFSRKIMEYFADVYSGKFSAPNLAERAMHITKPGVAELAYTQAVLPALWARNTDGTWFGITYKRDTLSTAQGPTFAGFHRHTLGSGRILESICSGPSTGGNLDALTMVTSDGATRHVEVMTDQVEEGATLAQAAYLDDAVNPTSVTSSSVTPAPYGGLTLNGLWHLNGKTVQAWIGGLDCGLQENRTFTDFVVANGSITIPYGDGVTAGSAAGRFTAAFAAGVPLSQMLVGFTYTSDGQLVRPATPAESGSRAGPALALKRRTTQFSLQVEGTNGVSIGTDFARLKPVLFKLGDKATTIAFNQQFSGVHYDTLADEYSFDSMLCWRVTRPYPCNIAAMGGHIETQDK